MVILGRPIFAANMLLIESIHLSLSCMLGLHSSTLDSRICIDSRSACVITSLAYSNMRTKLIVRL